MLHLIDGDREIVIGKALPDAGDRRELLIGPFAHLCVHKLLVLLGVFKAEMLEHVADGLLRVDAQRAVGKLDDRLFDNVVLVPDLADELLEDILDRDDADGAAVVVRDDGDVLLALRHDGQQLVDVGALVDEEGLVQQRADVGVGAQMQIGLDEFADLQHADDVVDRALVDGQTAVVLAADGREDRLKVVAEIDRREVDARREDALDRDVAELERGGDQLSLLGIERALLGHVLDDVVKLILGDGDLRVALRELRRAVADRREQRREGRKELHQQAHQPRAAQQQLFIILFAQTLRQHFAGEEHDDRRDDRAERNSVQSPSSGDRDGHDRGDGDMYDVRTDQYRGDRAVKMVQQIQGVFRPRVAALRRRLDPDARNRSHGRFGNGKIHGAE